MDSTVGRASGSDVPAGEQIVGFGEAVVRGSNDLPAAREALRQALGEAGFVEACGIAGIFNGLVRNADFSGIPLDDAALHSSEDFRDKLGLNDFSGAKNSDLSRADASQAGEGLFPQKRA